MPQHMLTELTPTGPHGGPSWTYRGVTIHANEAKKVFGIQNPPARMPGTWGGLGNIELAQKVIDAWLDNGRLPAPYVNPRDSVRGHH